MSAYFFDDDLQWLVGSWGFTPSNLLAFGQLTHFYRPVIDLYFALATPLFRGSPVLFHLANIDRFAGRTEVTDMPQRQSGLSTATRSVTL